MGSAHVLHVVHVVWLSPMAPPSASKSPNPTRHRGSCRCCEHARRPVRHEALQSNSIYETTTASTSLARWMIMFNVSFSSLLKSNFSDGLVVRQHMLSCCSCHGS